MGIGIVAFLAINTVVTVYIAYKKERSIPLWVMVSFLSPFFSIFMILCTPHKGSKNDTVFFKTALGIFIILPIVVALVAMQVHIQRDLKVRIAASQATSGNMQEGPDLFDNKVTEEIDNH